MSSFYTRRGDEGITGLLGKKRVPKDDLIIQVLGNLDELSSVIGLARSANQNEPIKNVLIQIQRHIFRLMSEIAASSEHIERFSTIKMEHVEWLEMQIRQLEQSIEIPPYFILPGDSSSAAMLDLARSTARRAERYLVALAQKDDLLNRMILKYINRLSSLLFMLELYDLKQTGLNPTSANEEKV